MRPIRPRLKPKSSRRLNVPSWTPHRDVAPRPVVLTVRRGPAEQWHETSLIARPTSPHVSWAPPGACRLFEPFAQCVSVDVSRHDGALSTSPTFAPPTPPLTR